MTFTTVEQIADHVKEVSSKYKIPMDKLLLISGAALFVLGGRTSTGDVDIYIPRDYVDDHDLLEGRQLLTLSKGSQDWVGTGEEEDDLSFLTKHTRASSENYKPIIADHGLFLASLTDQLDLKTFLRAKEDRSDKKKAQDQKDIDFLVNECGA